MKGSAIASGSAEKIADVLYENLSGEQIAAIREQLDHTDVEALKRAVTRLSEREDRHARSARRRDAKLLASGKLRADA